MQEAIELFATLQLGVIGLSHVVQHRAWAEFFVWLHGLGRPGVLCNGAMHLLFGSIVVSFHGVWTGVPALLTALGWAMTAKGALYLCVPGLGARVMATVSVEHSQRFVPVGVLLLAVATALGCGRLLAA